MGGEGRMGGRGRKIVERGEKRGRRGKEKNGEGDGRIV
jgi:hypothetical protein